MPSRHRETLARQAKALHLDAILAGLDILSLTKSQLKTSNHGRTLVEMALVRLGRLENLVALPQLVRLLSQQRGAAIASPAAASVAPPEGVKKKPPTSAPENGTAGPRPLTPANLPDIWAHTLRKVPGLLARFLEKGGIPAISAPNSLVLRFPVEYNQAREHCQDSSCSATVETALREVTGQSWVLRVESLADAVDISAAALSNTRDSNPPSVRWPASQRPRRGREAASDPAGP